MVDTTHECFKACIIHSEESSSRSERVRSGIQEPHRILRVDPTAGVL